MHPQFCFFSHQLICLSLGQEWGDPRKEEFYYYMKSYSLVDNVSADRYVFVHKFTQMCLFLVDILVLNYVRGTTDRKSVV